MEMTKKNKTVTAKGAQEKKTAPSKKRSAAIAASARTKSSAPEKNDAAGSSSHADSKKKRASKPDVGTGKGAATEGKHTLRADGMAANEKPTRRTQAERRAATRQRLVDATLQCLAEDGYAGTTINRIVEKAEVSHGASGHYFPSKAAMIQAAAEELMRQAYKRWGAALLNVSDADDRLDALLGAAWSDVFNTEKTDAFIELMQASKKDAELRELMQPMIAAAMTSFRQSAEHFFVAKKQDVDLYDMMILTQWLFRGMAMDQRIARSPKVFAPYLQLWKKIMAEHVAPKPGVSGPPPRETGAA